MKSDTFPIVAFVEKLGARPRKIASLYVGRWEGDRLIYAGKARSGYTEVIARELRERLDPLIRRTSPLSVAVRARRRPGLSHRLTQKSNTAPLPTMVYCAQLSSRGCETTLVRGALERHPWWLQAHPASRILASLAKTSSSCCRMPSHPQRSNSPRTGRRCISGHWSVLGIGRSNSCGTSMERHFITRDHCRKTSRVRCINCTCANARAVKASAYG